MSNNYKDQILKIIKYYGINAQFDILIEECAEVIQAVNKYKRTLSNEVNDETAAIQKLFEEIADVEVIIDGIKMIYPYYASMIKDVKQEKVSRQIDRIKEQTFMTKEYFVDLNSIDKVKSFVNDMSKVGGDVTVSSGQYIVDGKSIMGLFSLDFSKPLRVTYNGSDSTQCQKFIDLVGIYVG